ARLRGELHVHRRSEDFVYFRRLLHWWPRSINAENQSGVRDRSENDARLHHVGRNFIFILIRIVLPFAPGGFHGGEDRDHLLQRDGEYLSTRESNGKRSSIGGGG